MKRISVLASLCVILFSSYGSTQSVGTFPTIQGFWKGTYSTRVGVNDELGEVCLPSSESNIEQTYTLQIENDRIVRNFEEVTRDVELDATTGGVMVERRAAQLAGTVQAYNTSSGLLRWQRDGSESSECSVLRVDADGSIVELFWRATEADAARCDELAAAHSDAQPPSCDVVERPGLVRSVDYDSVRARGTASRACLLSAWSEIGECSQSCGGGTLTRERHVLNDYGNASLCDDEPLTSPGGLCNAGPCQPCVYTAWSTSWSPCNVTCGAGTQYRTRTPLGALSAGNPACVEPATPGALPPTHETRSCQPAPPVCAESRDCVLTAWSAWAACTGRCRASASAPAPTRSRHRAIAAEPLGNGAACGALIETVACNEQLCEVDCERCNFPTSIGSPTWCRCCQHAEECRALGQSGFVQSDCVDNGFCSTRCNTPALCDGVQLATGPYVAECVLGPWSGWSPCSGGTCASDTQLTATGTRSSHRLLVRPGTSNAPPCGELVRSESCERDCEVPNSEFDRCLGAPWSAWPSFCRCGQQRTRTRLVALESSDDDVDAQCAVSESQPCPDQGCARDCRYGSWSSWSACTRSCGIGLQTRTRDIVTPASENGTPCRDSETRDQRECNSVLCDIDCVLSAAVETGDCSTACGPGSIPIEKRIIVGPVGRNAEPCDSLTGTRSCDLRACQPGECGAFPWSQWTACSVACGGGVQTRNRVVPAESCGEDVSSVDERVCNEKACAAVLETFADIGVFGDDAAQLEQNLPALAQALSVQEQRLADVTATSEADGADEYRQNGGGVLRVFDAENEPAQAVVDTLLMRLASGDSSALGGVSLESGAQLSASSYEPVTTLSSPTITPGASDGPATASNTTLPVPGATSDEGLPIWIPIVIVLAVICLIGGAIAIVLSVLNARRANEEAQGVSVYGTVSRTEQLGPAADEDSSSIDEGSEIREFRRKQEARRARRAQAVAAAEKDTKKPVVEKESSNRDIVKTDPVDNSESGSGSYSYSYSYQSYTD